MGLKSLYGFKKFLCLKKLYETVLFIFLIKFKVKKKLCLKEFFMGLKSFYGFKKFLWV